MGGGDAPPENTKTNGSERMGGPFSKEEIPMVEYTSFGT